MKPEKMHEEIVESVADCDHVWRPLHIEAKRDYYDVGLHKTWVAEKCLTCGAMRHRAWKTDKFPRVEVGDE